MKHMSSKTKLLLQKPVLLLCVLLFSALSSFAQSTDTIIPVDENPEKLLRKINIGKPFRNSFSIWHDKFSGHFAGVDFGFNMFLNEDYTGYDSEFMANDVLNSNSVYINFVQQSIGLQQSRNTIGLVTGIGLRFYNYRLDKYTTIERDAYSVIQPKTVELDNIKKSNLGIMSLVVPLLAEFQVPTNDNDSRVYISGGMYGSIKLTSHTKVKYKEERNEKLKVVDHFSLRDFNYGIMVRTGYRGINLFATYDLVPLFRENRGPELTPFTFGFTLVRF